MTFETEYLLSQFREIEKEIFTESGVVKVLNHVAPMNMMRTLINLLVIESSQLNENVTKKIIERHLTHENETGIVKPDWEDVCSLYDEIFCK